MHLLLIIIISATSQHHQEDHPTVNAPESIPMQDMSTTGGSDQAMSKKNKIRKIFIPIPVRTPHAKRAALLGDGAGIAT